MCNSTPLVSPFAALEAAVGRLERTRLEVAVAVASRPHSRVPVRRLRRVDHRGSHLRVGRVEQVGRVQVDAAQALVLHNLPRYVDAPVAIVGLHVAGRASLALEELTPFALARPRGSARRVHGPDDTQSSAACVVLSALPTFCSDAMNELARLRDVAELEFGDRALGGWTHCTLYILELVKFDVAEGAACPAPSAPGGQKIRGYQGVEREVDELRQQAV